MPKFGKYLLTFSKHNMPRERSIIEPSRLSGCCLYSFINTNSSAHWSDTGAFRPANPQINFLNRLRWQSGDWACLLSRGGLQLFAIVFAHCHLQSVHSSACPMAFRVKWTRWRDLTRPTLNILLNSRKIPKNLSSTLRYALYIGNYDPNFTNHTRIQFDFGIDMKVFIITTITIIIVIVIVIVIVIIINPANGEGYVVTAVGLPVCLSTTLRKICDRIFWNFEDWSDMIQETLGKMFESVPDHYEDTQKFYILLVGWGEGWRMGMILYIFAYLWLSTT